MHKPMPRIFMVFLATMVGGLFTLTSALSQPQYAHTGPTIITNVTVIDGLGN